MIESHDEIDIAIVGMGPAGLYTGWRLATAEPNSTVMGRPTESLRIALFDTLGKARVGGRLCTQPLPDFPFLAELGGMRFRSNQRLVSALVEALGLSQDIQPFDPEQRFYYLREKMYTPEELRKASASEAERYLLNASENGLLPHQLIEQAVVETLKSITLGGNLFRSREYASYAIDAGELEQKLKSASVDGLSFTEKDWALIQRFGEFRKSRLSDIGFWDLLQFQLSAGGWHLAHDGLGYESIMGNWNAAIALPWFLTDFAKSKAFTLRNGMASIPQTLYKKLEEKSNYSLHHQHELVGIYGADEPGLLNLKFAIDGKDGHKIVKTRAVVLALPKGALVRLEYDDRLVGKAPIPVKDLQRRAWFQDLLHSVDGRPLFKLFLGYSKPWWTETKSWSGNSKSPAGKANTDLPLRQVYYYGRDQWNKARQSQLGLSGNEQHSMIMASYSDSHYVEFWSEVAKPSGHAFLRRRDEEKPLSSEDDYARQTFGAPVDMILRAEHQLGLLHGSTVWRDQQTPRADTGLYMEWSRAPYYAGWHSWKLGVKPWDVSHRILQPFGEERVYICGEAYSTEQGWTEGALKSAERLLSEKMNLPFPTDLLASKFDKSRRKLLDYVDAVDFDRLAR